MAPADNIPESVREELFEELVSYIERDPDGVRRQMERGESTFLDREYKRVYGRKWRKAAEDDLHRALFHIEQGPGRRLAQVEMTDDERQKYEAAMAAAESITEDKATKAEVRRMMALAEEDDQPEDARLASFVAEGGFGKLGTDVQPTATAGKWYCPDCNASNLGRNEECYACGRSRD